MKWIFYYHVSNIDATEARHGHIIMISEAYAYDYYEVLMGTMSLMMQPVWDSVFQT